MVHPQGVEPRRAGNLPEEGYKSSLSPRHGWNVVRQEGIEPVFLLVKSQLLAIELPAQKSVVPSPGFEPGNLRSERSTSTWLRHEGKKTEACLQSYTNPW